VLVRNWHALAWESEEQVKKRKSVDKHGVKSDEAYAREVLGEMEYGIPKSLPEAPGFIS